MWQGDLIPSSFPRALSRLSFHIGLSSATERFLRHRNARGLALHRPQSHSINRPVPQHHRNNDHSLWIEDTVTSKLLPETIFAPVILIFFCSADVSFAYLTPRSTTMRNSLRVATQLDSNGGLIIYSTASSRPSRARLSPSRWSLQILSTMSNPRFKIRKEFLPTNSDWSLPASNLRMAVLSATTTSKRYAWHHFTGPKRWAIGGQ